MSDAKERESHPARDHIEKPRTQRSASEREPVEPHWDVVDEASWESFPASDPPAYNRGHSHEDEPAPEEDA